MTNTEICYLQAPKDLNFTFYGPTALRVLRVPTEEADDFYQLNSFAR
jgi:hypothetical protein